LSPTQVGLIFSLGAIGGVVGALIGSPIGRRFGMGPTLAVSIGLTTIPLFFYPTVGASAVALPGLAALNFVTQAMNPIYNINQVSYRQAVIPVALQGRMNATVRTLIWGTIPLGALIGGVLGRAIGLVPTIYASATVGTLAVLWILAGPVRVRNQPTPEPS
jgi:predicted MFS family arabinose efflux permease